MAIARTLAQRDMVCYDFALDIPNLNALVSAGALSMPAEFLDTLQVIREAAQSAFCSYPTQLIR
jgi:hypothetical protein